MYEEAFKNIDDVFWKDGCCSSELDYIDIGEDELEVSKLTTVIRAKYGSISAAQEKLGTAQDIQKTFIDFQANLYEEISV